MRTRGYTKMVTRANGRRYRVTFAPDGRIIETTPILTKTHHTRVGRRLSARLRKIRRRL